MLANTRLTPSRVAAGNRSPGGPFGIGARRVTRRPARAPGRAQRRRRPGTARCTAPAPGATSRTRLPPCSTASSSGPSACDQALSLRPSQNRNGACAIPATGIVRRLPVPMPCPKRPAVLELLVGRVAARARDLAVPAQARVVEQRAAERGGLGALLVGVRAIGRPFAGFLQAHRARWWPPRRRTTCRAAAPAPGPGPPRRRRPVRPRRQRRPTCARSSRPHCRTAGLFTTVLKVTLSAPCGPWMSSFTSHQPVMLNFMPSSA